MMFLPQSLFTRVSTGIGLILVLLVFTACSGSREFPVPAAVSRVTPPVTTAPDSGPESVLSTEVLPTAPVSEDAYPLPGETGLDGYPGIEETAGAYPYPGVEATVQASPAPESSMGEPSSPLAEALITPSLTITAPPTEPTQRADDTYPGPGGTPSPGPVQSGTLLAPPPSAGTLTLTPPATFVSQPGTTQPALTPGAPTSGPLQTGTGLPPTAAAATPTLTPTPSLTPTLTEPDPEFHPTNPKAVELVSGKVQLIEFFAYWCGSCRALAPTIHRLEDRYGRQMNFIYLDTDNPETKELKRQLGFRSEPHIFLLDEKGKILRIWGSGVTAAVLEDAIRSALD